MPGADGAKATHLDLLWDRDRPRKAAEEAFAQGVSVLVPIRFKLLRLNRGDGKEVIVHVDADVLLVWHAWELERLGDEVPLVLVHVDTTISSWNQYTLKKGGEQIFREQRRIPEGLPWAKNAMRAALGLDWSTLGAVASKSVVKEAIKVSEEGVVGEEVN